MTLIAGSVRRNVGVLFADTLITTNGSPGKTQVRAPLTGAAAPNVWTVRPLQKLIVTSARSAIAWAGDVTVAMSAVPFLAERLFLGADYDAVKTELYAAIDMSGTALISWVVGDDLIEMVGYGDAIDQRLLNDELFLAAGTGVDHFFDEVLAKTVLNSSSVATDGSGYLHEQVVRASGVLISDIIDAGPLISLYGNACEFAYVDPQRRLVKCPFALMIWLVDNETLRPHSLYRTHYDNNGGLIASRLGVSAGITTTIQRIAPLVATYAEHNKVEASNYSMISHAVAWPDSKAIRILTNNDATWKSHSLALSKETILRLSELSGCSQVQSEIPWIEETQDDQY